MPYEFIQHIYLVLILKLKCDNRYRFLVNKCMNKHTNYKIKYFKQAQRNTKLFLKYQRVTQCAMPLISLILISTTYWFIVYTIMTPYLMSQIAWNYYLFVWTTYYSVCANQIKLHKWAVYLIFFLSRHCTSLPILISKALR